MKSVTSFFDKNTLRKDITRYLPVWLVYLIGGILVMLAATNAAKPHYVAQMLSETLAPFAVINMIYAALAALLLFGDLFNARLCNALHAMPLRREQWFFSHVISGFLFSFVPNTLGILLILPRLGEFWFVAFIWLLGMTLQYIFFFGVAVFSVFCTGNRFAAAAVYALLNFASILAAAFITSIYLPLLYGIQMDLTFFSLFSPICTLVGNYDQPYVILRPVNSLVNTPYQFVGLGDGWLYLWIIAAVGVVLLILSVLMYRRRALESAGDFIAVRPLVPVFSIAYTLTIGILFAGMGDLITGDYGVFLLVGIVVGFFTGQIMLQRTVKVFKPKTFLKCGAIVAALLVSMLLTWLDPLGITRYVPEANEVKQVEVELPGNDRPLVLTKTEDIQKIANIHKNIGSYRNDNPATYATWLTLSYTLENGKTVDREYRVSVTGEAYDILKAYFSAPEHVLKGYDGQSDNVTITINNEQVEKTLPLSQKQSFLEALAADCEAGKLAQQHFFHGNEYTVAWVTMQYHSKDPKNADYRQTIYIYSQASNTVSWLKQNGYLG